MLELSPPFVFHMGHIKIKMGIERRALIDAGAFSNALSKDTYSDLIQLA